MTLNLNNTFNPYPSAKSVDFEFFTFSGGEPHIKIKSELQTKDEVTITIRITSFNDVGKLMIAVNALKMMRIHKMKLVLPYFPGARQDRLMTDGEPLTVKVYADLINQLNFNEVIVFDAHSEVTLALLNNCTPINNFKFMEQVIQDIDDSVLLISPDGGALKKIYKLAAHLQDFEVVEGSKSRDVKTGKLSGFKVYSDDLKGKTCLVVDDICDGGGTFMGLAKELKAKNAGKLYLAVSHGIFSKGFDELTNYFEGIYTTDSFRDLETNKIIKQIKLEQLL